jgi:glucosamine-6-phosphate deaminase
MARSVAARTSPKTAASRNGFHVGTAGAAKLAGTTKPAGKPNGPAGVGPHPLAAHIEKIPVTIFETSSDASRAVAHEIAELIRTKAARRQMAVLGLATGSTPQGVYEELVRLHKEDGLSFANVITFNLDEYWPMEPGALQSYRRFMREHLFDLVNIKPENIHVPDGTVPQNEVDDYCKRYEKAIEAAGGIDIQILGIGRTGHVGFNEPGSARDSRTRLITLDHVTRMDASSDFFGEWNVPSRAITMGCIRQRPPGRGTSASA